VWETEDEGEGAVPSLLIWWSEGARILDRPLPACGSVISRAVNCRGSRPGQRQEITGRGGRCGGE
jgi:hypothetical protein